MVAIKEFDHLIKHGSFVCSSLLLRKWTGLKLKVMYIKKLRTSDWLKTSAFSCNTCAKLQQMKITNSMQNFVRLAFVIFFPCKLLTSHDMVFLAIWCNKHLQIWLRLQIAPTTSLCPFLSLKSLHVLINIKLHTKSFYYLHAIS